MASPAGPRADHRHVVEPSGIERGREAQAPAGLFVGRPAQDGAVRAEQQRLLVVVNAQPLDQRARFGIAGGVEDGDGKAVARQEALQPHDVRHVGVADHD